MAEDGIGFENAIAPGPSTYECMPGVWSGEVMAPSGENADHQLARMTADKEANMGCETLPEWFSQQGYSCGAFTSNPHTADGSGFSRGFDEYEDAIRETDALLAQLREDVPDDTNLVVHSDHGEEFGELDHGRFGHEGHLYEENVHVPLVIDTDDYDRTVEQPVSLADLPAILRSMTWGS